MPMKDLLIYVDHTDAARNAFERALHFARGHDVRLTALYVDSWTLWVSGFGAEMSPGVIDAQRELAANRKAKVRGHTEQRAAEAGVVLEWREDEGEVSIVVSRHARVFDALLLGHPWELAEFTDSGLVNAVALSAGRPVFVVPKAFDREIATRRILIAWDGGREAARAVHDALPLLREAEEVIAVTVGEVDETGGAALSALAEHLNHYQVVAKTERIKDEGAAKGRVLLDVARGAECDLVVMGCYGHSRLREMVLGGCTRHVLQNIDRPVWMSH